MSRYREAKCKICRREGEKLFLKGVRLLAPTASKAESQADL